VTNYYVYYRVEAGRGGALRPHIEKLFDEMQKHSGIRGRWMHRRDDPATYMEVYEGVKDEAAFEAALARASEHLGLERKTERFVCA
jgi:quinol monooxygenase YgiN